MVAEKNIKKVYPLFITSLDGKATKAFTCVSRKVDFFGNIKRLRFGKNHRYCAHEIIFENTKRKPYLDYEIKYETKKQLDKNHDRLIRELIDDVIFIFKSEYKIRLTKADILILDSSGFVDGKHKFSIHLIVAPKDKTYYYTNGSEGDSVGRHLRDALVNHDPNYAIGNILDNKVYGKIRNLRIIGSCRDMDDFRTLSPIDPVTLKPLTLTSEEKMNYFVTNIPTETKIMLHTPIQEIKPIKQRKELGKKDPTEPRTGIKATERWEKLVLELVLPYHPTAKIVGGEGNYYIIDYTDRNEICKICKKTHKTNRSYVIDTDRGFYLKCHHQDPVKKSLHIGYLNEVDYFIDEAKEVTADFLGKSPEMNKILKKWCLSGKNLAIKSPMGTGKTRLIKDILDQNKNFKKVLFIAHRQTLSMNIQGSFKDYGFINYLEEKGSLFKKERVIIQIDSLMRLAKPVSDFDREEVDEYNLELVLNTSTFPAYDLVIFDEVIVWF